MKQHLADSGRIVVHEECGCMATIDDFHACDAHQQDSDEHRKRFLEAAVNAQRKYNEEGLHGELDPEDPWDAHKVQDGN